MKKAHRGPRYHKSPSQKRHPHHQHAHQRESKNAQQRSPSQQNAGAGKNKTRGRKEGRSRRIRTSASPPLNHPLIPIPIPVPIPPPITLDTPQPPPSRPRSNTILRACASNIGRGGPGVSPRFRRTWPLEFWRVSRAVFGWAVCWGTRLSAVMFGNWMRQCGSDLGGCGCGGWRLLVSGGGGCGGSGGSGGCRLCVGVGRWEVGRVCNSGLGRLDVPCDRCYSRRVSEVGGECRRPRPSPRIAVPRCQRVHTLWYGSRWAERAVLGVQNPCQTRPSSPLPVSEVLACLGDRTRGHLSQLNPCCRTV
ncbi:hypothetical protein BDW22DRAFT_1230573 [Trametopsis cervina]|nr:hypothetical protein BDW22DRAFT_1230573 [Trametopsis cervina]